MLLSWKTCRGANTLHREGVCKCVCFRVSAFLSSQSHRVTVCVSVFVRVTEGICAIIRPIPCRDLFIYSGKQADILFSQSAQIYALTLLH